MHAGRRRFTRGAQGGGKAPTRGAGLTLALKAAAEGRVTSISVDAASAGPHGALAYVATAAGNLYQALVDVRRGALALQLVQSAHAAGVTAVAFPEQYGEVRGGPD